MNAILTVTEIVPGKYPKIKAGKATYGTKNPEAFEVGGSYEVEFTERLVTLGDGNSFKARDIVSARGTENKPIVQSQYPEKKPATNGSKYTEEDKKAFHLKDMAIARGVSLNNSALIVEACLKAWKAVGAEGDGLSLEEISEKARVLKHFEYIDNLKLLGVQPSDDDNLAF